MSDQWFQLFRSDFYKLDLMSQKQLFIQFRKLIYPHVYFILNDHAMVEDVIQEAFMKAIIKGPKTHEGSNMTAWLKKIARNTAFDFYKKNKKFRQVSEVHDVIKNESAVAQEMSNVQESVETDIRNGILYSTIKDLKPGYRMIIYLHYIEGLPYSEICKELDISEQVLAQRMARARKKLAKLFKRKWGE